MTPPLQKLQGSRPGWSGQIQRAEQNCTMQGKDILPKEGEKGKTETESKETQNT